MSVCEPETLLMRRLKAFEKDASPGRAESLLGWANPQSRALLALWHGTDQLPVSLGPGEEAARWRHRLFDDVVPQARLVPGADAVRVARELAESLGARPKRVVRAASALASPTRVPSLATENGHAERLRLLNWLDMELYERTTMSES